MGNIYPGGTNSVQLQVSSFKELEIIISHFEKYPLITQKWADFILFKQAVNLMKNKEHLTKEGLQQIVNIKASMNRGLSPELKAAFPNTIPVQRPFVFNQQIKDTN